MGFWFAYYSCSSFLLLAITSLTASRELCFRWLSTLWCLRSREKKSWIFVAWKIIAILRWAVPVYPDEITKYHGCQSCDDDFVFGHSEGSHVFRGYYRNWYQDWGHCGELPRPLVTPQWPKSRYQFLFYRDASKHVNYMLIRVCIIRKSLIKLLQISHYGKHVHRPLSQQLP